MVYLEIKLWYFILFTCHTIIEIQKIKEKWKKRSGVESQQKLYKAYERYHNIIIIYFTFICSLRSKHFQSSYCSKVGGSKKKGGRGRGRGDEETLAPKPHDSWKCPLTFHSLVDLQIDSSSKQKYNEQITPYYQICKITLFSNRTLSRRLQKL